MTSPVPLSGSTSRCASTGTSAPNSGVRSEEPTSPAYRSSEGCTTSATQAGSSSGRVVSTVNCPNASEYQVPSTSRSSSSACATAVPKSASQSVGPSAR